MTAFKAGGQLGNAFRAGGQIASMYKGGVRFYHATVSDAANLTQWHPRWAKIDVDAGYTEFTYTDELGASVSPVIADQTVACIGNRQNGIIYYFASGAMFRKVISNGVVGNAEKLWDSSIAVRNLSINEETGAVFMANDNQWSSKIVSSIETADSVSWQTDLHHLWQSPFPCWVQNKLLASNRLYDGSDLSYKNVPGLSLLQNNALFGDSTALFIQQGSSSNSPLPVFRYNIDANTVEAMFTPSPQGAFSAGTRRQVVYDSKTSTFLLPNAATAAAPIMRTTDGVTLGTPPVGNNPGGWSNRFFPHINILWSRPLYANAGVWWDGDNDTIGNVTTANSLFPGYVGGNSTCFYAGKHMLVNGNRLWDIVKKTKGE